jgi:hypothetical protein
MLITSIVFSKNRPLQLDLTLRSIEKNFADCSRVIVLHNNDYTNYSNAHATLCAEHDQVISWRQGESIFSDVLAIALGADDDYICFFTDDDIFYRPFVCGDYSNLNDTNMSCFSLRMGTNITERQHDGVTGQDKCKQMYSMDNDIVAWPKTWHMYGSYWSYDLSVDGHIFRKEDVIQMMDELYLLQSRYKWGNTPNNLESEMQRFWALRGNYILSPRHSVVVNSPNNRVQDSHNNRSGDVFSYDGEFLLDKYMSGYRINIDNLNFSNIKCPHTEIDLIKDTK